MDGWDWFFYINKINGPDDSPRNYPNSPLKMEAKGHKQKKREKKDREDEKKEEAKERLPFEPQILTIITKLSTYS